MNKFKLLLKQVATYFVVTLCLMSCGGGSNPASSKSKNEKQSDTVH